MTEENEKYLKQLNKELNDYIIPKLEKEGIVFLNDPGVRKILGFEEVDNCNWYYMEEAQH